MKLLGIGVRGVCWRDIETLAYPSGQPFVNLYGNAAVAAERLGLKGIAISLSHSRKYAIAFASGDTE
jgi:holo-[acyl-carrier protein] synthase